MKNYIMNILCCLIAFISGIFGGWNEALTTVVVLMIIDYVTGLVVAGVFKNSPKTETGALESKASIKGLFRKFFMLVFIFIGHRIDLEFGTEYIRDAICISFTINELLSIIENAGLMGVPIPKVITNAIAVLKNKEEETEGV